jgi:hypothetical protein
MRISCPKCDSTDVDGVHEIKKDHKDGFYFFISRCNICKYEGQNVTFWKNNGTYEITRKIGEVNKTEMEIWEKKNI